MIDNKAFIYLFLRHGTVDGIGVAVVISFGHFERLVAVRECFTDKRRIRNQVVKIRHHFLGWRGLTIFVVIPGNIQVGVSIIIQISAFYLFTLNASSFAPAFVYLYQLAIVIVLANACADTPQRRCCY